MAIKTAGPSVKSIYESIFAALDEYEQRHNNQGPAQITVSRPVYSALMITRYLYYDGTRPMFCNIPVVVTDCGGYHIHLAEPEIQIYDIPEYVPKLQLPPDHVPREG